MVWERAAKPWNLALEAERQEIIEFDRDCDKKTLVCERAVKPWNLTRDAERQEIIEFDKDCNKKTMVWERTAKPWNLALRGCQTAVTPRKHRIRILSAI